MREKRVMALITMADVIRESFYEQLSSIFGDNVIIKRYLLTDDNIVLDDCELVLCSSPAIYEKVRSVTPSKIKVINVRRALNLENLDQIFKIEPGTETLVVSNHDYTARETVELLIEMGIDHLNYRAYYPGADQGDARVAITPGGKYLVPTGIEKIIDIGFKLIDVTTIMEILLTLKLPLNNTNFLTARYTKKMVELNKYSNQLNMLLEGLLFTSHDGIIAINEDHEVMFINKTAASLLNLTLKDVIGDSIEDLIDSNKLIKLIIDDKNKSNELIEFKKKYFLINKEKIQHDGIFNAKVISIKDITQIQKQEYEIRKKLRRKGFVARYDFSDIIGVSKQIKRTVEIAKKIANNDLTVLIRGESGTGKELFAQAIHNKSGRCNNPFVAVNFAALSDSLIESELFGYEEGAFTGAKRGGKPGLFEQAHTGTIFIDEIGDAPPNLQARLLRVLQEKEVMRVGGNSIIPVNVRVIAATNKDLDQLVLENKFRKDLFYRLKVLYFNVPPLRERVEDIYYLVNYFLKQKDCDKNISKKVYDVFREHNWPGNVRELENIVNYIITVVDSNQVDTKNLPFEFREFHQIDGHLPKPEHERICEYLQETDELNVYLLILEILLKAEEFNKNIGRNRICKQMKIEGFDYSSEMVRTRINNLAEFGLVRVGKTRQGTSLTLKGKRFLQANK